MCERVTRSKRYIQNNKAYDVSIDKIKIEIDEHKSIQKNTYKKSLYERNGNKWSVNECLQLQREYELLELSVDEIAAKHKRSPKAIMFMLDKEGIENYNSLYLKRANQMANAGIINEEVVTAIFA